MGLFTSDKHAARKAPRISIYKRASERASERRRYEKGRKGEREREIESIPLADERTHTTQLRRREYVHLNLGERREGIRPRSLRLLRGCPLGRGSHPSVGETPFNDHGLPVRKVSFAGSDPLAPYRPFDPRVRNRGCACPRRVTCTDLARRSPRARDVRAPREAREENKITPRICLAAKRGRGVNGTRRPRPSAPRGADGSERRTINRGKTERSVLTLDAAPSFLPRTLIATEPT